MMSGWIGAWKDVREGGLVARLSTLIVMDNNEWVPMWVGEAGVMEGDRMRMKCGMQMNTI
jgi:hypothetical protein